MTEQDVPRLQITNPGEVAELAPFLIGFTPEESLVVIVTRRGRVEVTARADLPDLQPRRSAEDLLNRIWDRFPDANAYLIAYTNDHAAGWEMLHRCDAHLGSRVERQTMLVDHDSWELADGQAGTIDHHGPTSTQASGYGLKVRRNRADLEASFASAPDSDQLTRRIASALDTLPPPRDTGRIITLTRDLLTRNLPPAEPGDLPAARIPVEDAIKLAVLTQNPSAQSLALLSMTRDNAPQHLQLWRGIVNQVPNYGAEAPLYLAGMAAWISGDGASAVVALDRSIALARTDEPTAHTELLSQLIDQVVPPSAWPAIRADVLAAATPRVREATLAVEPDDHEVWETIAPPKARRPEPPSPAPPAPGIAI